MQDGTFESPGFSPKKNPQYMRLQYPTVQRKRMDGGFGKSRMQRETEISKVEFLAAGETLKA